MAQRPSPTLSGTSPLGSQDVMEDPVVCADGHSYERAAITQWLLARDTSPCTNAPLLHKNVVPNHALRNLIAEVRGVKRPVTLEEHVAAATPCCPEELDDSQDSTASSTAPTSESDVAEPAPVVALGAPRRDDETAAAPAHAAEAKQPIEPCAALCVQSAIGAKATRARPVGKNALHWAMVEGLHAEQKQLRLLLHPELAAQPDQGGNLPLHYAASAGASTAAAVACTLAFIEGLEWANKTGRTPCEIARLEGHSGLADVLSGMRNRKHNELHASFARGGGGSAEDQLHAQEEQLQLLACRPELAAQKDPASNLPLHLAASAGASLRAVEECVRVYPDAPRCRNADGLLPHQLALEHSHRELAQFLAARAGKVSADTRRRGDHAHPHAACRGAGTHASRSRRERMHPAGGGGSLPASALRYAYLPPTHSPLPVCAVVSADPSPQAGRLHPRACAIHPHHSTPAARSRPSSIGQRKDHRGGYRLHDVCSMAVASWLVAAL